MNIELLKNGNIRALSKFITLLESTKEEHQEEAQSYLKEILPLTGNAIRLGISGTPGVGKSSFIESLGLKLIKEGHKVAVLAIDPSSPLSGGSLLGDKTRMERLAQEKNAFIRPTPTSCTLGGVALKTKEAMLACEAAGYDVILIETVGVGQSEIEVSNIVDILSVLLLPGGGDELQGIKKGIIEICDNIIINKADGENIDKAHSTMTQYKSALGVIKSKQKIGAQVFMTSALKETGLDEYWKEIKKTHREEKQRVLKKRKHQEKAWLKKLFYELIEQRIKNSEALNNEWDNHTAKIEEGLETPINAAKVLANLVLKP